MPLTIEGEWVPNKNQEVKPQKSVKIRLVKRGKSILTVILNLQLPPKELEELASKMKRKLGAGGAIKEDGIEIQGDKVFQVKSYLDSLGIKSS